MDAVLLFNAVITAVFQYWFVIPFMFVAILLRSSFLKGMIGEWYVNKKLGRDLDNQQYKLFKNVTLLTTDGTTQIDHIILSPFGIFVIETKNMKGWIFGSERQASWTQQIYKHKTSFQNPLRQNYKHTETLRDLLALAKDTVHSIVIFTARAEFKTAMPINVGYVNDAIKFIKSHTLICFTELQVIELTHQLSTSKLQADIKTHINHVKHVKEIVKEKELVQKTKVVTATKTMTVLDSSDATKPRCPRCSSLLLSRKNRKTGETFIGCSGYPKCRYIGH